MKRTALALASLLLCCPTSPTRADGDRAPTPLVLVREAKVEALLGPGPAYEASGIDLANGKLVVVFDDLTTLGVFDEGLTKAGSRMTPALEGLDRSDLEGIAWDPEGKRWFVSVEAASRGGESVPRLLELDEELKLVRQVWLDPPVPDAGKGCEGLAFLRRGGEAVLLALLEGNHGEGGKRGHDAGHGLVRVYVEKPDHAWELRTTLELPPSVAFDDYAGIDVEGDRVAIVSQASSLLWVGQLAPDAWRMTGPGKVYAFPREGGRVVYGNVEGVAWLDERHLACCSDQAKADHPESRGKDQSIHVFELPAR